MNSRRFRVPAFVGLPWVRSRVEGVFPGLREHPRPQHAGSRSSISPQRPHRNRLLSGPREK